MQYRSVLAGLVLSVLAAMAVPAFAGPQELVSEEQARLVLSRSAATGEAAQRVTELMNQTQGLPEIASARTPEALAAAIEAQALVIAAARGELQAIHARLSALAPISNSRSPVAVRTTDESVRLAAGAALRADGILEAMQAVPPTVRAGDQAGFNAAYSRVTSGLSVLQDIQAISLRNQATQMEDGSSPQAQFLAMACYSEGQSALQAGLSGASDRPLAEQKIGEAVTCIQTQVAAGRAALEQEPPSDPRFAALRARLNPIDARIFDELAAAAALLEDALEAMARGDSPAVMAARLNPRIFEIIRNIQDLSGQQQEIMADQ